MLSNSGLSIQNYDKTLQGWLLNMNTPDSLNVGAYGLEYCNKEVRDQLIEEKNWTIEGDKKQKIVQ